MGRERTAVVLMNLGGPDRPEAVEPFLRNLFSDPDLIQLPLGFLWQRWLARKIASRRAPESRENYAKIGGRSPIVDYTREQARALEEALGEGFSAHVAMRYWHPLSEAAAEEVVASGARRVVALPLYPHRSRTTSHSSVRAFRRALWKLAPWMPVHEVCSFSEAPGFVDAWVEAIREVLEGIPAGRRERAHLLFSAHGLPQSVVDRGDPYLAQVEASVRAVVEGLGGEQPHSLAFQSRATRAKWLEPATEDELERLGRARTEDVVVVPIAFVTEHVETLFELDMLLKEPALEAGVQNYHRVRVPYLAPSFIGELASLVRGALAPGGLPPCPPPCNNPLCVAKRRAGVLPQLSRGGEGPPGAALRRTAS